MGYSEYKELVLRRRLWSAAFLGRFLDHRELPKGYGRRLDERVVEYPWLFARLGRAGPECNGRRGRLLDAGSALNHAFLLKHPILSERSVVSCTLATEQTASRTNMTYVRGDLRHVAFRDGSFDEIACISTLEHVGMDNSFLYVRSRQREEPRPDDYRVAIRCLRAALRPGGRLYLTVPFGRYEDHGWLQQFDGHMVESIADVFEGSMADITCYRYTADGWQLADARECEECRYFDVHRAEGFDPDRAAAARAVACLTLVK